MMYSLVFSLLIQQVSARSIVCNNCSGDCVAQPNNPHNAQDDHCAPCANGQAWWPCDRSDLCQCKGNTDEPQTQEPEPEIVPCTTACSSCVAQADNAHNASDAHCAPCANGQAWWPCNNAALCQCADLVDPKAPVTDAPVIEAPVTEAPVTDAPVTEAPVTEAPTTQAPTTQVPTTQAPTTPQVSDELIRGHFLWSWNPIAVDGVYEGPADSDVSIYWSSYGDVVLDLQEMTPGTMEALGDEKWFSLGIGSMTELMANNYVEDLGRLKQEGFTGVVWKLHKIKGSAAEMIPILSDAFAAVKAAGLVNAVNWVHTAPHKTDSPQDATDFVTAFLQDPNIDIVTPWLFSWGQWEVEYTPTESCSSECGWELYRNMRPGMKFVPTIAYGDHYEEVAAHFLDNEQIETKGYFIWKDEQSNRRLDTIIV